MCPRSLGVEEARLRFAPRWSASRILPQTVRPRGGSNWISLEEGDGEFLEEVTPGLNFPRRGSGDRVERITHGKPEKCSISFWFLVATAKGVGMGWQWKERPEGSPRMGPWEALY